MFSSASLQCLVDDPLDLTVGAAELVRSPLFDQFHGLCVDAQHETLGLGSIFCHLGLLIEGAGIDNRLSLLIATEDNQEVGYHCSLLLVVEFEYILLREFVKSDLHH